MFLPHGRAFGTLTNIQIVEPNLKIQSYRDLLKRKIFSFFVSLLYSLLLSLPHMHASSRSRKKPTTAMGPESAHTSPRWNTVKILDDSARSKPPDYKWTHVQLPRHQIAKADYERRSDDAARKDTETTEPRENHEKFCSLFFNFKLCITTKVWIWIF